jgi:hypothetical protein
MNAFTAAHSKTQQLKRTPLQQRTTQLAHKTVTALTAKHSVARKTQHNAFTASTAQRTLQ